MGDTRERPGFMIYTEDARIWDEFLTDAELAQLIRAIIHFVDSATEPEGLPKHVDILYRTMRGKITRDRKKYDAMCERKKQAAIIRESKKKVRESQDKSEENIDNTRKNKDKESTTVQNSDNSAQLSQEALTVTVTETVPVTVPVTETYTLSNTTTTYSFDQLTELWNVLWSVQATQSDTEAFQKMVNEGYTLEDIKQAMRQAHERADENPIGYMFSLLRVWKENGKPKRPHESREIMQRHSNEEIQKMIASAVIDLDYEE